MLSPTPGAFRRQACRAARGRGQTLVEFALVLPLFMVLLMGVIEFGFMFNATLAINFASRNASLIAAEAGSQLTADCAILSKIEQDVGAPLDKTKTGTSGIQSVTIYKADRAGNATAAQNVYDRSGSMVCDGFTPNTVPYTLATNGYPVGQAPGVTGFPGYPGSRCDVLSGCSATIPMDSIGVKIVYRYYFHTPLRSLVSFLPGASGGFLDFTWSNVMRMEPIL
jgi:Flp pilus assembly protein TadG